MKWRVLLELTDATRDVRTHEIIGGGRATSGRSPDTIGLTLAEAKSVLSVLQTQLVQAQADGYL